jgi:hypothetical protein
VRLLGLNFSDTRVTPEISDTLVTLVTLENQLALLIQKYQKHLQHLKQLILLILLIQLAQIKLTSNNCYIRDKCNNCDKLQAAFSSRVSVFNPLRRITIYRGDKTKGHHSLAPGAGMTSPSGVNQWHPYDTFSIIAAMP